MWRQRIAAQHNRFVFQIRHGTVCMGHKSANAVQHHDCPVMQEDDMAPEQNYINCV